MLDSIMVTFNSIVRSKSYELGLPWFPCSILKYFDFPDLVGALASGPCWLLNDINAKGKALHELKLSAIYHHALGIYTQSGAPEGANFLVQ